MSGVRAKKHLGQHFLKDEGICKDIATALTETDKYDTVLEVGPGMGALTKYLIPNENFTTEVVEIDRDSIGYLGEHYPDLVVHKEDFLKMDLTERFDGPIAVIGNFPYNISSQILFHVIDHKNRVPEVVGMFQKEVAVRIAEPPGTKKYGIISVLLQAYYDIEYLFTVHEHVFNPPPKVKSGVIRLIRNKTQHLGCDEKLFKVVVKMAFNQRRKTLRNSIKALCTNVDTTQEIFNLRPERLSVEEFVSLTKMIEAAKTEDETQL